MEGNNGRLRKMLTQFLNKKNRDNDNASMEYLNNQMQMVEEQIKSVNDDMMNISNLYYQALSEGNIEQASMLQNQIKDMKERKKRYKQQKKQIEDNIDEIKDLQDIGNYSYVNLSREFCIYDEDKELVTKYEIINIDN